MSLVNSQGPSHFRVAAPATSLGIREPVRVLVADNDPTTGRLLNSAAEKDGYRFVTVEDGREAYRILKLDSDFRAVVFDLAMPNLEGVEIVRYMKTEKRLMRIPIVVLAGGHGLGLIAECFAAGAMAFLPKPFTTEQLRRTLRMVISRQPSKSSATLI